MMFSIIQNTPERFIPRWLMNWLERYLNKRITELEQQSIKMTWQNMYLQDTVNEIQKSK